MFELLYSLDCDPRQFEEYTSSYDALTQGLSSHERLAIQTAEQAFIHNKNTSVKPESCSSSSIGNSAVTKHIPYEEAVVEVDTDNRLPELEKTALTDPIVLLYNSR